MKSFSQMLVRSCFALITLVMSSHAVVSENLIVGVRVDAPPFSFHPSPNAEMVQAASDVGSDLLLAGSPVRNGFKGYIVTVCEGVLDDLKMPGLNIFTRPVDAGNRFELLKEGKIHVLCDPATITEKRLESAVPSVPIYMSAISYVKRTRVPGFDDCRPIVGIVSETTAPRGIALILDNNSEPLFWSRVNTALQAIGNGEASPLVELVDGQTCPGDPIIKRYSDHNVLAQEFCDGDVVFYVGDVEIIRAKTKAAGCIDSSVVARAIYSHERYAIFYSMKNSKAVGNAILEFQKGLFGKIFPSSDRSEDHIPDRRSLLVDAFKGTADLNVASDALRTFFWSVTGDYP